MKPTATTGVRLLPGAAAIVAFTLATTIATDSTFSDAAIKRAIPQNPSTEQAAAPPKRPEPRAFSVMKKVYKDVQHRSCRPAPRSTPPSSSWPARGQSTIAICS